jgi:hypothetical protein
MKMKMKRRTKMNNDAKLFRSWWDTMILWDSGASIGTDTEREMFQFFLSSGYLLHLKKKYKDRSEELLADGLIKSVE